MLGYIGQDFILLYGVPVLTISVKKCDMFNVVATSISEDGQCFNLAEKSKVLKLSSEFDNPSLRLPQTTTQV